LHATSRIGWSLDRIGRNTIQILQTFKEIHDMGADVKVLSQDIDTRTPSGRMVLGILATISQFERELILERTMHGLAKARERGRVGGRQKAATDKQVCEAMKRIEAGENARAVAGETGKGMSRQALYRRAKEIKDAKRSRE
jgi:DNA invertase Pin-like site-specific DNA recombinase